VIPRIEIEVRNRYSYNLNTVRLMKDGQQYLPNEYLSLTYVCRQTNADTRLLPLSINTVRVIGLSKTLSQWLERLSEVQVSCIRTVRINARMLSQGQLPPYLVNDLVFASCSYTTTTPTPIYAERGDKYTKPQKSGWLWSRNGQNLKGTT
jgi:hypothetical protein